MRVAAWTETGIEVVERDPGPLADGHVRLRITGCGICGSDLLLYRGMRSGALAPSLFPNPGHEMAGVVADGPAGLRDTVYAVEPWVNCRTCPDCLGGTPNRCETGKLVGIEIPGGLAETVDVPLRLLHPVEGLDPTLASLAEPWAVSTRAVHRARLTETDERLLVLGGGTIGLMCGLIARDRVARVGITCRYPHQADLARRFGLEPIGAGELDAWAAEHRPGAVIETVGGESDTMTEAVQAARRGGRIVVVGIFGLPRPTDYVSIVLKELEVVGSMIYGTVGSGSEFAAAVKRMPAFASDLPAFQTHRFGLADVAQAFAVADDKSRLAVKVTIG